MEKYFDFREELIPKSAYNITFIIAFIFVVLYLGVMAYFFDKFRRAEYKKMSKKDATMGKNVALGGLILACIFACLMAILYFIFRERVM